MMDFAKIAYDIICRRMRNIVDAKSTEYNAGYVQGVVDLQTEIYKNMESNQKEPLRGLDEEGF